MKAGRIILTVAALLLTVRVVAADPKIAVVDMGKVFDSYYKTKISAANLKKQAEVFKAYAQKLDESRRKLTEEFNTLRDESQNIALSRTEQESKRLQAQEKYRQLKEKEAELTQYNKAKYKQLNQERNEMRDSLLKEIRDAINKRATLTGYALILDKSGNAINNLPVVIFSNPAIDITDSIIEELNRGYAGKTPSTAPADKDVKSIGDIIKENPAQ
ncbi:MAG: OmpH family outer membrane protein [Victivallales bacterium]|nr:OmpH family outer membrane protein [Victivallales bacterium]